MKSINMDLEENEGITFENIKEIFNAAKNNEYLKINGYICKVEYISGLTLERMQRNFDFKYRGETCTGQINFKKNTISVSNSIVPFPISFLTFLFDTTQKCNTIDAFCHFEFSYLTDHMIPFYCRITGIEHDKLSDVENLFSTHFKKTSDAEINALISPRDSSVYAP